MSLQVVEEQEALNDQDVDLLVRFGRVRSRRQGDAVGTGKLHRVLHPAFYRVGHRLHIQTCDDCRAGLMEIIEQIRIDVIQKCEKIGNVFYIKPLSA